MGTVFKTTAHDGLARCGLLICSNISTPAPMLYTRRGTNVFLTSDMLEKLRPEAQLVQINTLQFLNQPGPDVLRQFGRSIHHYLGLSSWPVFASNRDPALTEYLSTKPATNTAAYVTIHSGALSVSPERYMEAIAALQPDMFVALADEVPGNAKPKRVTMSVDRSIQWLDECIKLQQQQPEAPNGSGTEEQQQQQQQQQEGAPAPARAAAAPAGGLLLFAPVVGGASETERGRSAKAVAERDVAGFALCGFGMGEHFAARPKLLSAALQHLPADKPRVAVGLATANGYALAFPLSPAQQQQAASAPADTTAAAVPAARNPFGATEQPSGAVESDAGADDSKINLWALTHRLDKGPLVAGCGCFTCRHHSRAYIHHLLHTHEMLAGVLLEMHNTHWWLGFFAAIRQAIQEGRLEQYVEWFSDRRSQLQQQEAQKPQWKKA